MKMGKAGARRRRTKHGGIFGYAGPQLMLGEILEVIYLRK